MACGSVKSEKSNRNSDRVNNEKKKKHENPKPMVESRQSVYGSRSTVRSHDEWSEWSVYKHRVHIRIACYIDIWWHWRLLYRTCARFSLVFQLRSTSSNLFFIRQQTSQPHTIKSSQSAALFLRALRPYLDHRFFQHCVYYIPLKIGSTFWKK